MKVFQVTENVFKVEPLFVVGCSYAAFLAYMKRRFHLTIETEDSEELNLMGRSFTLRHEPWRVIFVKPKRDIGILVHEITHLVTRIFEDRGIPIRAHGVNGESNDEPAAYLIEYFIVEALRHLKESPHANHHRPSRRARPRRIHQHHVRRRRS